MPSEYKPYFTDIIQSPKLAKLYGYWQSRSDVALNGLPRRKDVDPIDIPSCLADLFLVSISPVQMYTGCLNDFDSDESWCGEFRLVGSQLESMAGEALTGQHVCNLADKNSQAFLTSQLSQCIALSKPVYGGGALNWFSERTRLAEWLFLPLSNDGKTVNMVMGSICLDVKDKYSGIFSKDWLATSLQAEATLQKIA